MWGSENILSDLIIENKDYEIGKGKLVIDDFEILLFSMKAIDLVKFREISNENLLDLLKETMKKIYFHLIEEFPKNK